MKVRHHQHDAEVVIDNVTKEVIKSNYIGALCSRCNIRITMAIRKLPCFAHNATRYDNHFVLSGMTSDFHEPSLISKSGENFLQMEINPVTDKSEITYGLRFINSFNFLSLSLDSLTESLKK